MNNLPKPISTTKDTVVLNRADWEKVIEALEDAEDRTAVRASRARAKAGHDDSLPAILYRRIRAGESPVRVWRTHRKLGLNTLAARASVARGYLSEIETGKKPGSAVALRRIADALEIDMDELVPQKRNGRV
jgi:DNA-binding Xre family transcriptional regulator